MQGKSEIAKVITGVTATQALIDQAITQQADAILVHHGYFWKGEAQEITGMKQRRIKALLAHNINLIAYHLPLDVHPEFGNNRQLAHVLGLVDISSVSSVKPEGLLMLGELPDAMSHVGLASLIEEKLDRPPLSEAVIDRPIKKLAWCTGGGQGFIEQAVMAGADAFITGEVSEQTIHTAREMGIDFYSAGHHATERYGAKALGEYVADTYGLNVSFIDIPNPA
ncbi:GTP cyclohydrolase 1 type 2 [Alteromonas halophila]|uniref:GTP cyclohydrolase 1 type 2 homolog n=1 Tax=Alteromonas halophila TaxID=516698 RepID=A0A918JPE0_9ALTE|nr:GTP cyclohydrolase 1 type 2 [Alteromonas halophila]